jgi:hypothetical protein
MSKTKIVVVVTSAFINSDGEAEPHIKTGLFSTEDAAKSWLEGDGTKEEVDHITYARHTHSRLHAKA